MYAHQPARVAGAPAWGWAVVRAAACLLASGLVIVAARAQSPTERVFEVHVERGEVVDGEETLRVTRGDVVELRWHSDEHLEAHLHGYDRRVSVGPGAAASLRFRARAAGRFPITRHDPDGHGHATLLYLEVYPR